MRQLFVILLALMVCFAMPLMAQEKEKAEGGMADMAPPEPLNDDWHEWMVGEWEGWSESEKGKTTEWLKCDMGLNGQFLFLATKSEMGEMTREGRGASTIDPESGAFVGYWVDNFRGMYEGKGKRADNKVTTTWEGNHGTYKETVEKVGADKFTSTYSFTDANGKITKGKLEMTRIKKMTDKKS